MFIENIIYLFYKMIYLNEEVYRTESFPSISFPWNLLCDGVADFSEFFFVFDVVHFPESGSNVLKPFFFVNDTAAK
jgi:hypothetical protein